MADKVKLIETPDGWKDTTGRVVIYPQPTLMHDSEYQEILNAAKAGKSLSKERSDEIQSNLDLRYKMKNAMQQNLINAGLQQNTPTLQPSLTQNNPLNKILPILGNLTPLLKGSK